MKPIGRNFGFWVLFLSAFGASYAGLPEMSAIFLVGSLLFDAIKAPRAGE